MDNYLKDTIIQGNFVGRDYYNIVCNSRDNNLFRQKIFLHYIGDKISNLLYRNDRDKNVRNTNKLVFFLFDDIYLSISDLLQSYFIYDDFFDQCLKYNHNFFTIIGNASKEDVDVFLTEREKFYFNTDIYRSPSLDYENFKEIVLSYESIVPKDFRTKKHIVYNWKNSLNSFNGKIDSIDNFFLRNAIISAETDKIVDKLICLPDKLQGLPFVWDSFKYLSIIPGGLSSDRDFELYLASQWIKCYIDKLSCSILDSTIGCKDCSFRIPNLFKISSIFPFLKRFNLVEYILKLQFIDFANLKYSSYKTMLQHILMLEYNGVLLLKNDQYVYETTQKIYHEETPIINKLKNQVELLYEWKEDIWK